MTLKKPATTTWNFPSLNGHLEAVCFFVSPRKSQLSRNSLSELEGMSRSGLAQLGLATFWSEKQQLEWVFGRKSCWKMNMFFFSSRFQTLESPKELFVLFWTSKALCPNNKKEDTERDIWNKAPRPASYPAFQNAPFFFFVKKLPKLQAAFDVQPRHLQQ